MGVTSMLKGGQRGQGTERGAESTDGRSRDEWKTRQKKDRRRKRTCMGRAIATRRIGERGKREIVEARRGQEEE